jgi:hypothetical protein
MKNVFKSVISVLFLTVSSVISYSQNYINTNVFASGLIVTPITITKISDLTYGNIFNTNNAGGTVKIATGSVVTAAGVTLQTGTRTSAVFSVVGNKNNTYIITIANLPTLATRSGGTETMGLGSWTSNIPGILTISGTSASGSRTISSAGTDSFEIGATLTVGQNQKAGTYSSSQFTVTVSYN